jgi:6-phosphogluconate dehydrogenase (decarboxylating)
LEWPGRRKAEEPADTPDYAGNAAPRAHTLSTVTHTRAAIPQPVPLITQSLIERLRTRDSESFSDKLLSAMRIEFGGHEIKKE